MSETVLQSHMDYPGDIWQLASGPNPELLHDYLSWLAENDDAFASAAAAMQRLPVGLDALTVAKVHDRATGKAEKILQLNFYHEDNQGNEDPHGHSRKANTVWYAPPEAKQIITRHLPLPEQARRIAGLPLRELLVVPNIIVDYKDGRRPGYNPLVVGERLVIEQSETRVASLGSQTFGSLEVHHIGFRGKGVAISVQYKGPEETAELSTHAGLVDYKGLSAEQAEEVVAARQAVASSLPNREGEIQPVLGPVTMIYKPQDFDPTDIEVVPRATPTSEAEKLIIGGLRTATTLRRAA